MNLKRVGVAALAAWALYLFFGFVVHGVLLKDLYLQHVPHIRPETEANAILPIGFGVSLVGFFAFAYAYAKGYEGGAGMQEGLRFGVLVGIMLCSFAAIWEYMVWPARTSLLMAWFIDDIVEFAIYGAVVGAIYKPLGIPARRTASV
jgi:hypothetical protein